VAAERKTIIAAEGKQSLQLIKTIIAAEEEKTIHSTADQN